MAAALRLRRLLLLLPGLNLGGTERHGLDLARRLATQGIDVTLAAEPSLLDTLPQAGLALRTAAIGWDESLPAEANIARQQAALSPLLAEAAPDAVLLSLPWPNAGLGLQAGLAETHLPRLILLHLATEGPAPPGIAAICARLGLDASVLAAVSAPVARRAAGFFGLDQARIGVLHNPAPLAAPMDRTTARQAVRQRLGLPASAPVLLFLGRLEEAKGADLLPGIGDRLSATLAIGGEGALRGMLEARALADPRGLFRVLGPLPDPALWLAGADAVLLPSRLEGAPLVFLEAAAQRCPVIATAAALEALGPTAPAMARIVATPEVAPFAAAAQALLADSASTGAMLDAAEAHARARSPAAALKATLGLLRAAVLRATLALPQETPA